MKARPALVMAAAALAALPGPLPGQVPRAGGAAPQSSLTAPESTVAIQQAPPPPVPKLVRHGKWVAAGLFAGATALGLLEHHRANSAFDDLRTFCADTGPCAIGPDGRYTDARAEAQYQRVVAGDRAARAWFVTGQVALAGTAALFVVDLLHPRGTKNIPFTGLTVVPLRRSTGLGFRIPLGLR